MAAPAHAVPAETTVAQTAVAEAAVAEAAVAETTVEEITVTATRAPETTFVAPQPVTVLDAGELQLGGFGVWTDALRGTPGIAPQSTSPGQGNAIVRGLKGSEVLHLVDGFRLNMAIFRNAPNNYLALVDPASIDRIEIVRGASSTLYGSDAMGGVVHLSTAAPPFEAEGLRAGGGVAVTGALADRSVRTRVEGELSSPRLGARLGASWNRIDELRTGDGVRQPHTAYQARGADARLGVALAPGQRLGLGASYFEQPETPRYDELVPGFGQSEAEYDELDFEPGSRLFGFARYELDAARWADHAELGLAYQLLRDDRSMVRHGSTARERERNRSALLTASAHARTELAEGVSLAYGTEATHDVVSSSRTRTPLGAAAEQLTSRFPDGATQDGLAAYLAPDLVLDDWLDVHAGTRVSWNAVDVPADAERPGARLEHVSLSGHAGISVELADGVRGVARVGRGFRAPNVYDLGVFGPRPGERFSVPNPDLGPELAWSYDAGVRVRAAALSGELFVFRTDYRDKLVEVDTGEVTPLGERVVQMRNVASVDYRGIEGIAQVRVLRTLSLRGTLTYVHGTMSAAGSEHPADRVPPLGGSVAVQWRPDARWSIELTGDFAAPQRRLSPRDATDPRIDPSGTDGYALLGARIAYSRDEELSLSLRAENLTDASYREHGSGIDGRGLDVVLGIELRV